ncbi:MAG TPA: bacillithiol biosynthesis BshC, partial [Phnomibacter sp.]|nr:bacillithiol biosynthesis BshC [Phnomibacter sp.]
MSLDRTYLPYHLTGAFSKLVRDLLSGAQALRPFYQHEVSWKGLEAAMQARDAFDTPRALLHQVLMDQYEGLTLTTLQQQHLEALKHAGSYTIVTAHQPNIFTGPLYFIYKILHAIRLADNLQQQYPHKKFVPVYYMGSEDADLDELGHIYINGEKLAWDTDQAGAVGRMHTKGLKAIADRLKGQFGNLPHGEAMVQMIEEAYLRSANIQQATLKLVHQLFASFGLLVIIPDDARVKRAFAPVMKRELLEQFSSKIVQQTIDRLGEHYKVQAAGRDINLFYLFDDGRRERIEKRGGRYHVLFSDLHLSEAE